MVADALDEAILKSGGVSALAELLGASAQTVSNWRKRGVPANVCKAIEAKTGVGVRRLRPDDWMAYWPEEAEVHPQI